MKIVKIRHGFVSNSSSSSFLLIFTFSTEDTFASLDGFRREFMMKPDQPVCEYNNITFERVSEEIYNDLKRAKRMDQHDVEEWLHDHIDGIHFFGKTTPGIVASPFDDPREDNCDNPDIVAVIRAKNIIREYYRREFRQTLIDNANDPDVVMYQLRYEDSCELGIALEHGDHWYKSRFIVIRVSNH